MKECLEALVEDNYRFVSTRPENYFTPFKDKQSPRATLVLCSDSRVQDIAFSQASENDFFVVRNIGNQLGTAEGSVEYGVKVLRTPLLVFIGHSDCGAVKAAKENYSKRPRRIKSELVTIKVDDVENVLQAVVKNVDYQVKEALEAFDDEVDVGTLGVIGAIYDFRNDYGKGEGKLIITNINGETDPDKIKNSPLLTDVSRLL